MYAEMVIKLLSKKTGYAENEIRTEYCLKDLGIDSFEMMDLFMELEELSGIKIKLTEKANTVDELIRLLEKQKEKQNKKVRQTNLTRR